MFDWPGLIGFSGFSGFSGFKGFKGFKGFSGFSGFIGFLIKVSGPVDKKTTRQISGFCALFLDFWIFKLETDLYDGYDIKSTPTSEVLFYHISKVN